MSEEPARINAFDEFLDRLLRGEDLDAEQFLRSHPELPADEQAQVRRLCTRPATPETGPRSADVAREASPFGVAPIERIGPWRISRRIGAGAMGVVFLAHDEDLGRDVAIKILGPDLLGTGERSARFLREVRSAARLRHPNIVTVHAAGEDGGFQYMVMEYVPGSGLQEVMADHATKGSRTPVADALKWGTEIARALHAAHEAGVLHRDVKPSNIRITPDGRAVLLDFGLAREAGDATLTETGAFRGSPQYASPEQVDPGPTPIDARTDVYSLGATLYEMLTGVAPFRGETRENLFHNILAREPVPLRRLEPSIPRDLETVVMATLAKEPSRRPSSAAALAADLEAVRDGRPVSIRPPSVLGRLSRWGRRNPARAGLALALALGIPAIAALGGFVAANLGRIKKAQSDEHAIELSRLLERGFLDVSERGDAAAQATFEEAMKFAPESEGAKAGYVLARLADEDGAGALAFLDQLPESVRKSDSFARLRVEAMKHEALQLRLSGDRGAASRKTAEVKSLEAGLGEPSTSLAHFLVGFAHIQASHLRVPDALPKAIDHLRSAIRLSPHAVSIYYFELGHALMHAKLHDEARQVAEAIESLWPESPERWFAIGRTLREADPAAAARAFVKACNPPPLSSPSRDFITIALSDSRDEAQRRLALDLARGTVGLAPDRAFSYYARGVAELANHDSPAAAQSFREAIRRSPRKSRRAPFDATAYRRIAQVLQENGDHEGAIDAWRDLLRFNPRNAFALNSLGVKLLQRGDVDEAISCFEEEVKLDGNDAEALCNLGRALQMRGELARGLETLRKGHEVGSTRPSWKYPSAAWVADAKERLDLERQLDELRRGGPAPAPDLALAFASKICRPKKQYAEAVKLYAQAFADDPALLSETVQDWVLEAASTALLAGIGEGVDAPTGAESRRALREQASHWLASTLATAEADGLEEGDPSAQAFARIRAWMKDRTLARNRASSDLPQLTAEEIATWRASWKRCEAFLARRPESASSRVTK